MELVVVDRYSIAPAIRIDVEDKHSNVIEVDLRIESNKFTEDKKFVVKVNNSVVLDQR
jgi:hypothetical protein